jgi:glycosyltransferase involved in cell wall biosynthesis
MDSNKVTIVIPCYNQAQWLPDAIESALNQTVKCDVIVVNDGSTDNTRDVAMRYPVTMTISKKNGGLSSARNSGIRASTTEWILPLDADDKIAPDMVEKCLAVGADIIGVGQETFGDYVSKHIFKEEPTYSDFKESNQINCCSLYKKTMWQKLGGYDENMREGYEDWDFWLRATQKGYIVKAIPEFLFFYRKHGRSMVDEATEKHSRLVAYMLDKHKK